VLEGDTLAPAPFRRHDVAPALKQPPARRRAALTQIKARLANKW
jgi:hypothetical protein